MDLARLPLTAQVAIGVATCFLVYRIYLQLALRQKRHALAREKGCLPSPQLPQRDKIFGWDVFKQNTGAFKNKHFLELSYQRFQMMGVNTYQFVALGRRMHVTIEPENLKTIQAIEFKKWGLGRRRKAGFRPLLGDGEDSYSCLMVDV